MRYPVTGLFLTPRQSSNQPNPIILYFTIGTFILIDFGFGHTRLGPFSVQTKNKVLKDTIYSFNAIKLMPLEVHDGGLEDE